MYSRRSLMVSSLLALVAACGRESGDSAVVQQAAADATAPRGEGEGHLAVDGGRIWYKISGAKAGTPVVLLHGGPGFSSYYLKPLEALSDERMVVRYDQLGGGKSSGLTDTTKITIAHFVNELDSLRAHLGFEKMHLVGHSWGTILGLEYYRAHPDRVASLTLASAALDIPQWERHARALLKTLPDSMQRAVSAREAERKFDAPDYQAALEAFYAKYVWLRPVKPDLDSMMRQVNGTVYGYMQGPSEFTITGTLKTYDATPFLKQVKVPTLFTVGAVDEADPVTIRRHAAMVPGGRVALIPNAAHITTWDNPEPMITAIRTHLKAADAAASPR
ncbi:MAG TPA: proline iminopeptidase-family hydrolase [Gemmatimonadaceae bacterium]|jgi:proline iminopeptidase|nr:proline iminopeptidase-family hydrolase [Gemmatimonadaceae bacterium]